MFEDHVKDQPHPLFFGELIQSNDKAQIEAVFEQSSSVEITRMITSITKTDQIRLLEILGPEESAHFISKISDLGTGSIVTQLPTPQAVSIVKEMSRDQHAHFPRTIGGDDAKAILDEIKPEKAKKIRALMSYPDSDYDIQYAYVVSNAGRLIGGLVPLILRGMRIDPALASGPLLTTVTDMCGFFFVLSFASILFPRLTG